MWSIFGCQSRRGNAVNELNIVQGRVTATIATKMYCHTREQIHSKLASTSL